MYRVHVFTKLKGYYDDFASAFNVLFPTAVTEMIKTNTDPDLMMNTSYIVSPQGTIYYWGRCMGQARNQGLINNQLELIKDGQIIWTWPDVKPKKAKKRTTSCPVEN